MGGWIWKRSVAVAAQRMLAGVDVEGKACVCCSAMEYYYGGWPDAACAYRDVMIITEYCTSATGQLGVHKRQRHTRESSWQCASKASAGERRLGSGLDGDVSSAAAIPFWLLTVRAKGDASRHQQTLTDD